METPRELFQAHPFIPCPKEVRNARLLVSCSPNEKWPGAGLLGETAIGGPAPIHAPLLEQKPDMDTEYSVHVYIEAWSTILRIQYH